MFLKSCLWAWKTEYYSSGGPLEPNLRNLTALLFLCISAEHFSSPRKDPGSALRRKENDSEETGLVFPLFDGGFLWGIEPGALSMGEAGGLPHIATHWLALAHTHRPQGAGHTDQQSHTGRLVKVKARASDLEAIFIQNHIKLVLCQK